MTAMALFLLALILLAWLSTWALCAAAARGDRHCADAFDIDLDAADMTPTNDKGDQ